MATKKFTDLNNYPSGSVDATTDILAIVDITSDESKKITVQDLGGALTASFAISASYALNATGGGGTNISEVYFVTPSGDNGTAEAGNLHKPYSTPEGARAAAAAAGETSGSLIHVFPGEYTVTTTLNQDYVGSFYFEPEAIINHTAGPNLFYITSSVANSERELAVYGHGKFKQNGNGSIIYMASSSRVYFECDTIIKEGGSANTIYLQQNADLDFKANLITGSWGSTYFITPRDESYVTAHINNLEYFGNTFCIYPRQGVLTSPNTTRIANEFTIENFIIRGGYGGLIGGGPSGRGNTFHLDVKNMYITGSALGGFAVQSAGEVNYSKFVFHNAIMDCSSNSWGFFQDSSTTGENEIIFEGSLKYNGSNNNKPAFTFNGGDITLDMWVECSGSSLGYQINHSGGDLYLNKSLYNETGDGVNTTGGTLYIDNYKIVTSGSAANYSIKSTGARNIIVNNILSSNSSVDSNITNIGPGFMISGSSVG